MRSTGASRETFLPLATASFALVLLMVAIGGWLTWRNVQRIAADNDQVVRTYAVMQASSEILRALRTIESNSRLFELTAQHDALEAMQGGRAQLDAALQELLRLTAARPKERQRVEALQASLAAWLASVDAVLLAPPVPDRALETLRPRLAQEHRAVDALRAEVLGFENIERGQLAARASLARRSTSGAWATAIGATTAAIALLGLGAYGVRRELALRRGIERALEHSEARYRVLVENLPYALFVNQRGSIVFANDALASLLGAEAPAEVLGRSPLEFVDASSMDLVRERIRSLEGGDSTQLEPIEERWRRRDGSIITCMVSAERIEWLGAPAILAVLNDITQRTLAEAARRESEAQLAAVVASAMDAIVSVDEQQRIVLFNAAAEGMFGIPAADALGQPLGRLLPERFRETHAEQLRRFGASGITSRRMGVSGSLVGLRASGEEFPVEASISRTDVASRRLYTVVVRDITARERREEELRIAQNQLTHMSRLSTMGEMASGLSHEINQPLTAIATYAQALERLLEGDGELDRAGLADVARQVAAQALRAGAVIRRLRAMIRNQAPRFERLRCGELLEEVRSLAEVDARIHTVQLRVDARDPQLAVRGNAVQLQQVLINLIRNAIDALEGAPMERRSIELRQFRRGDAARFEVVDHGPGVPAEQSEELFRPFFTTKSHGTGLGLAISRSIMTAHQGRLEHQPTPGGGATFTVTLPAARGDAA